jgi:dipeptide transport system permease protein
MSFLFRRVAIAICSLFGVSLISFALIRMIPGDPILLLLGERGTSVENYQVLQKQYGLDQPLIAQYGVFVGNALRADFGHSITSNRPVTEEFLERFPATIELGLLALCFAVILGIPLGVWAAIRRNSAVDYMLMAISLAGYSMPIFWWGLILILFFSVQLGWTPVSGRLGVAYDITTWSGFLLLDVWRSAAGWSFSEGWLPFKDALAHLVLPSIALGTVPLAVIARMTRSSMLEVMGEDYIRTARAKGLSRLRVIWIHGLRNALVPVITVVGLMAGTMVTGAVLTETIFAWPGVGRWLVDSVLARDYPVIQSAILFIAMIIVGVNILVDLAYVWANPRLRGVRK